MRDGVSNDGASRDGASGHAATPDRGPGQFAARVAAFDVAVENVFEAIRSPGLDRIFFSLSTAADHSRLWHACGIGQAVLRGEPARARRLSTALAIESFTTNVVVKSLFRRVRPESDPGPLPFGMRRPVTSAFPSGHAAAAFTAAGFLAEESSIRAGWYTLALSVAASRVYTRMHHGSDVVGGIVLGIVLGRVLRRRLPTKLSSR